VESSPSVECRTDHDAGDVSSNVLTAFQTVSKASKNGDRGGEDIFVHISAVERAGFSTLSEGQVVQYEEVSNRGRTAAENLRIAR
jgi:cold shock CspA family protein